MSAELVAETLEGLGIPTAVLSREVGPRVDRYCIALLKRTGKRLPRIADLRGVQEDLAIGLGAPSVEVYVDRGQLVLEVAKWDVPTVNVGELKATGSSNAELPSIVGVDARGVQTIDLADMPHLLIAGTTGSGKSVLVHCILYSLLKSRSPKKMILALVDPKRVELHRYRRLPHLVASATDKEEAEGLLKRVAFEVRKRYEWLSERELTTVAGTGIPRLVLVIDELADLILGDRAVERALVKIAQLGRAAGVHIIAATQRPSADVITGLIKANFPARISLAVPSGWDSKVILDQTGAEKLLGKGDALFRLPGKQGLIRMQVPNVTPSDSERVVKQWSKEKQVSSLPEVPKEVPQEKIPYVDPETAELVSWIINTQHPRKGVSFHGSWQFEWPKRTVHRVIKELERRGYLVA